MTATALRMKDLAMQMPSVRALRVGLLTYGALLAVLAASTWSAAIPTQSVQLQGSRQTLLKKTISTLDQGGPPLIASSVPYKKALKNPAYFIPANYGDDEGIYLYLPVAGHLLGDRNPLSLEKWFAIGSMLLIPLLYPLIFFELFESLAAALIVPYVAIGGVQYLINTDIYWITAWILLLGLPLIYLAAKGHQRRWVDPGLLILASLLASFATSVRVHAGLGVALAAVIVAVWRERSCRRRVAVAALVGLAYLSIAPFSFSAVRAYRDHVSHMPSSSLPSSHGMWHATYLGLGYLPNRWGIRWDDAFAVHAAQRVDPKVVYLTPHYERTIRHLYVSAIRQEPGWAVHLYAVKLAVVVREGLLRYADTLLFLPLFLALGPLARRGRTWTLLLLPALLLALAPALLTLPMYDTGFLGGLALASFLVLGGIVRAAASLLQVLGAVDWKRLIEGQPMQETVAEARAALRSSAGKLRADRAHIKLVVAAIAVVAATAAGVILSSSATTLATANEETAYYYQSATLVSPLPRGTHVLRVWQGKTLASWVATNAATAIPAAGGVDIQTTSEVESPQFASPTIHLPAGRYGILVSGGVTTGGLQLRVVSQSDGSTLAASGFWHGQKGLNTPGMIVPVTLSSPKPISVSLANWRLKSGPSTWRVRRVELLRLPDVPASP